MIPQFEDDAHLWRFRMPGDTNTRRVVIIRAEHDDVEDCKPLADSGKPAPSSLILQLLKRADHDKPQ